MTNVMEGLLRSFGWKGTTKHGKSKPGVPGVESMAATKPHRYGLVGHPVEHSRSPLIHQLFAKQTGEDISYELIDAEPESFETAVRGFGAAGGGGLNVTVPHKEAAFALMDEIGADARRARAVNTVTFLRNARMRGDNTDGVGFMRDLTMNLGEQVRDRRVVVLGAGGAARGILGPLLDAAPAEIVLANRTRARAEALAAELGLSTLKVCLFEALAGEAPFEILINTTSAGLRGKIPALPASAAPAESLCYDLAYSLKPTPFMEWARAQGVRRAVQGWGMLVEQAAESFFLWRGRRPDTAPILAQMPR
jgi:shikimate dehydrogenase